jgi:hypothetical protein
MKRELKSLGAILAVLVVAHCLSCTAKLQTGKLDAPSGEVEGEVAVKKCAKNMKQEIGWGSFTLFAIPVQKITVEGDADEELMRVIKETVEHVGYTAKVVEQPEDADCPVICVNVKKFFFYNYTWLAPLVFNWGNIEMEVSVKSPQGETLWSKDYKGSGTGFYHFDPTVNMALNKVLNQMVVDLASPEFKKAVFEAQGPEVMEEDMGV